MQVVHEICCGIDVHAKMLVACLWVRGQVQTRTFATVTRDLLQLRDWLVAQGCTHVALESTGVYWQPVFNLLEDAVTVVLVNPAHTRVLRGHKTDVKDARWLAELLAHGLVRASFIPPPEIRGLRELTRYRESLVREHTAVANRIQKVLEGGNIKLGQVASDVLGVSGRAMLRALSDGETDVVKLAALARGRLRDKRAQLQLALDGRLTAAQRFVLGEQLQRLTELEAAQGRVEAEIARTVADEAHPELARAVALLDTIHGIGPTIAQVVVAEIGANVAAHFPDAEHLASWAGLCPGNKASGGKRLSGRTREGNRYLRAALVQAAWAATHERDSYLHAQYQRLVRRMGKKKALVAVAHSLLVIIYYVLVRGQSYQDLGGDYFDRQHKEQQSDYLVRRLAALGYEVTLAQAA